MATIKLTNAEAQTISSLQDSAACFVAEAKHFLQHFVRIDAYTHSEIVLSIFFQPPIQVIVCSSGTNRQTEQISLSLAMVPNPKSSFLYRFQSSLRS